ncbi:transposase [Lysobacter sp. MMG2]|uniref:REP-associated tyrosine transposase n=1 Tax=Lysobacter sp. MMG2 TaxID=2801338 RepID=UPI001C2377EF|nr:transposase [Lysobacter sp. MMG2]MBU8975898.1 transposase [Lysobacter sp. MMG2]
MVRYRRNRVAGGTYFFTVTLRDRRDDALVRHVDLLRVSWLRARPRIPHEVVAAVVLPDHLHAVIRMADADADYSRLWQEIKKGFSRRLPVAGPSLWQPRFWEHTIRDHDDLRAHVDYVHFNPVKHGLVRRVIDWPHSSFHRYVRNGELEADWGGTVAASTAHFGEVPQPP